MKTLIASSFRIQCFLHNFLHLGAPSMATDRKYLKLRNNTWYFQKRVPKALQEAYPDKAVIEESLETGCIREARRRRDIRLGRLTEEEEIARTTSTPRHRFLDYQRSLREVADTTPFVGHDLSWGEVLDPESVGKADDPEYIEAFKAVLRGETDSPKYGVTLAEVLREFLQESERESLHTPGTRLRFQRTVKTFLHHLGQKDVMLRDVSRESVFSFISASRKAHTGATVQGSVSRLKTLWQWGYSRAWVRGANPFAQHQINTTRGRKKVTAPRTPSVEPILVPGH